MWVIDRTRQHLTHFEAEGGLEDPVSDGTAPTEVFDEDAPELGRDSSGAEEGGSTEGLSGYIVSVVGRKRCRRLHHLTKCGLIPGRDYREYEVYGAALPPPDCYDSICSRCWRSKGAFEAEGQLSHPEPRSASSSGESDPEAAAP